MKNWNRRLFINDLEKRAFRLILRKGLEKNPLTYSEIAKILSGLKLRRKEIKALIKIWLSKGWLYGPIKNRTSFIINTSITILPYFMDSSLSLEEEILEILEGRK